MVLFVIRHNVSIMCDLRLDVAGLLHIYDTGIYIESQSPISGREVALVFALVGRFTKRPLRTYQVIAFIGLLLSFFLDGLHASALLPGADLPNAIALIVMHVIAWPITVLMLTRLTKA